MMAETIQSSPRVQEQLEQRGLPDTNRLSVLTAMLVLAYTLANYVVIPEADISAQVPGFYLAIPFNIDTFTAILVAGLMATGSDWLLRDHPALKGRSSFPHWILPALTALVIGVPLNQLPYGPLWWLGLLLGTLVVVLVLIGEYISIDTDDIRHPLATAGLSAVAYTLFLVLVSTLRSEGLRLFFIVPLLTVAVWLVCMRAMHLRLHGEWTVYEAAVVAFIIGQIAAAFHYWPLSPVSYGLALLGLVYALNSLICGLIEEKPLRKVILEPLLTIIVSWSAAFWLL
jgi:hypothetical protein